MIERDNGEASNNLALLRDEISRLRASLASAMDVAESERDVDSVTDYMVLQQEVDTLRQALREKDRVVDVTAAQCRRLEDELEDQNLAYDGLKQDLDRKKLSLTAVREQVARLSAEHQELEERYHTLLGEAGSKADGERQRDDERFAGPRSSRKRFIGGLVAGVTVGAVMSVLFLRPDLLTFTGVPPSAEDAAVRSAEQGAQVGAVEPTEAEEGPVDDDDVTGDKRPEVVGTVRDRLRDGSSGPLMLSIKAGDFTMGKPRALPGDDRGPAHPVMLAGYLLGATEVTFDEYDRFVRATGGRFPNDHGWGRGGRPVVDVSWSDAQSYARWLSRQTGGRYRLPSEAEWEYAAAAGAGSPFWWGYKPKENRAACFDCGTRWDNRSTAPVGTFDPNPLGLYDTAGNAMEWVEDCYHPSYVGAPGSGIAWTANDCGYRVARGGSFNKPARSMGSTVRHRFDPATRLNMLGFRLARDE